MDEYSTVLLSASLGFIGTMVGAAITWWVTNRATKTQAAFDLHREFNSEDLLTSRHAAQNIDAVFVVHRDKTLDQIFGSLTAEERFHLWNVIHFHQRLYVIIAHNRCNTKLIPELFGEVFYWWYLNCFEKQLVPIPHREASKRIYELKKWFDKNSPKAEVARWAERAKATSKV